MEFDSFTRVLKDFDNLLGLFLGNANVVLSLQNQQRRLGVAQVLDGRGILVDGAVFYGVAEQRFFIFLEEWVFVLEHREPVDDPELLNSGSPNIGSFAESHEGHVSTVRAAGDANLLSVDEIGVDEKMCGIDLILKIASAKILVIRFLEGDAVAGGPSNIRSDADVATAVRPWAPERLRPEV